MSLLEILGININYKICINMLTVYRIKPNYLPIKYDTKMVFSKTNNNIEALHLLGNIYRKCCGFIFIHGRYNAVIQVNVTLWDK